MQSLAVPLRHHRDFRSNMIDDIVSSQLLPKQEQTHRTMSELKKELRR